MDLLPTLKGESVQMDTRHKGRKLMTAPSYFKGFYLLSLEDWAALTYIEQLQSWDNSLGNSAVEISG
jgi:hypothetical protein